MLGTVLATRDRYFSRCSTQAHGTYILVDFWELRWEAVGWSRQRHHRRLLVGLNFSLRGMRSLDEFYAQD